MNICSVFVEHFLDDRGVCPCGAEDELAGVQRGAVHRVGQGFAAAVDEGGREGGVEGFGVLLREGLVEDVVPGGGQAVGAHAAVVGVLVGGLAGGGEADDEVAWIGGEGVKEGRREQVNVSVSVFISICFSFPPSLPCFPPSVVPA